MQQCNDAISWNMENNNNNMEHGKWNAIYADLFSCLFIPSQAWIWPICWDTPSIAGTSMHCQIMLVRHIAKFDATHASQ